MPKKTLFQKTLPKTGGALVGGKGEQKEVQKPKSMKKVKKVKKGK